MQRVRATIDALIEGERELGEALHRYLVRVHRLGPGDRFVAFDPAVRTEADAEIVAVGPKTLRVRVSSLRVAPHEARAVTWIHGLAKGEKCDAIVRDATELGATRVVFACALRATVKLDEARRAAREERLRRIATDAARQSERGDVPAIEVGATWASALASVDVQTARFCLYERATEPLGPPLRAALESGAALGFAAGPEGGLDDSEVTQARDAGWAVVSLGETILRTETVPAAVLGAVRIGSGARSGR